MPLDCKVDLEDTLIGRERKDQSRPHETANNPCMPAVTILLESSILHPRIATPLDKTRIRGLHHREESCPDEGTSEHDTMVL